MMNWLWNKIRGPMGPMGLMGREGPPGEAAPYTPDRIFDAYTQAALTGLLANPEVAKHASAQLARGLSQDFVVAAVVESAMEYARDSMVRRARYLERVSKF